MINNRTYYEQFCNNNELPLFFQSWWLDATAGENNWDVVIYKKSNEIFGVLPYYLKKKWGFNFIGMPPFTQHLGPWLIYPKGQKNNTKLSFEKEVLSFLISQLPKANIHVIKSHHSIQNILPFVWKGYKTSVKYTYILENIFKRKDDLFNELSSNTRKNIKKAEKLLNVVESENINELFSLFEMTFNRQKLKVPYEIKGFKKLFDSCKKNNCCKILLAKDSNNHIHSGIFLVWSAKTVYYLIGGSNPDFRNSEAMSLVMWEGIQLASRFAKEFDFEGTMVESIERFIRGFGAIQKPYFQLSMTRPKFLKPLLDLKYDIN